MLIVLEPITSICSLSSRWESAHAGLRRFANQTHLHALLLIAFSVGLSLFYTWFCCPLDLAADEAHYWDWSRHLDWSYYSKGPLVAWLIRASCEVFGGLSLSITGNLSAAVRLPAALCHGAILGGSYILASGALRSSRAALAIVAIEMVFPLVRAGSVLMTIDPPFLACWCWAMVCVWKGVILARDSRSSLRWWIGSAVFAALGTLAKYTMALFPVAVLGYLLVHHRSEFSKKGIWILLFGAAVCWIPIAVWNGNHDWVSFRHVFGQVGGAEPFRDQGIRWLGPLVFIGGQAGILLLTSLLAFLAAGWRFRPTQQRDAGLRLLWWSSIPVWCLFATASFVKSGQLNWPAPAYLGGMILAGAWIQEQWSGKYTRLIRSCVWGTLAVSLLATAMIHFPGFMRAGLAKLARTPSEEKPLPVRQLDISARLMGWKSLASEVDRIRTDITLSTGEEPVLAGTHWTLPGQLGFYCDGHPTVYSLGIVNGSDRHSQYELWRPNPEKDAQAFRGRTFVVVGQLGPGSISCFETIEKAIPVKFTQDGVPIAAWNIWICRGFSGLMEIPCSSRCAY